MRFLVIALLISGGCSFEGSSPIASPDEVDAGDIDAEIDAVDIEPDAPPEPACVDVPDGALAWWDGEELGQDILGDFDMAGTEGSPAVAPGLVGNATTIGQDDAEWVTISPPPELESFTIEAWLRRSSDDDDYQTVYGRECRGGFGGNPRAGLFLLELRLTFWFTSNGLCNNGEDVLQGETVIEPDEWHHVAATYDGDALRLYVDGELDGEVEERDDIAFHPNTVRIGGADVGDGQSLVGQIDELTIYDRALEASELAAIAAADEAGKCAPE